MDFQQLVHACFGASSDHTETLVHLPIVQVRPTSSGDALFLLQDELDPSSPIVVPVSKHHGPLVAPYLQEFLHYAQNPEDVEAPCLPVRGIPPAWRFDVAQAMTDQGLSPESADEGRPVTAEERPVRVQFTVTAESARKLDAKARSQGLSRTQYLLNLVRFAVNPI